MLENSESHTITN